MCLKIATLQWRVQDLTLGGMEFVNGVGVGNTPKIIEAVDC